MADETTATVAPVDGTTAPAPAAPDKKRGKWATKDYVEYPYVKFNWSDGTVTTVDVESFTDDDRKQACLHGFSQKLGDSYSKVTSLEEAKANFDKQLATIREKGFTGRVEGITEEPAETLAQAIVLSLQGQGKPATMEKILPQVQAADRKQRNVWRQVDSVAFHLARLRKHAEEPNLDAFGY